ncbi:WD40-repeat-containing domain protein [Schizophyllum commune]
MRFRTLEIRWHDSKPISSCDFQPRRARSTQDKGQNAQSYRLATAGEDNHVRIWMVHPHLQPAQPAGAGGGSTSAPRPPHVEYLATLSRHSAAVNVVRFSPNGELIASAGDDGMIIIWAPSLSPQAATYGSDLSLEDLQHEKEFWKPRTTFRCTQMQVYDLAWSPTGEYLISGSTDNVARVYSTSDGKCVHEIAEHNHYVQGVAWDPLNEYIATQSSDRSMHIYSITTTPQGGFEAHAIGKNTRMPHRHTRTPSAHGSSRPPMFRSQSTTSDIESITSEQPNKDNESVKDPTPLTPATSVTSTPSMFPPPSYERPSSRRSSFSSAAPGSPSTLSRYGRSPSPMPALPAIRAASPAWTNVKLYGDESYTNFFRRLSFSPDGGLLLTPAGQFEDPSVNATPALALSEDGTPARGRKSRPTITTSTEHPGGSSTTSSVYIYSRANFARPPIAQLPGHKKASIAVRFVPQVFELRRGVTGAEVETHKGVLEGGQQNSMDVDIVGPTASSSAAAAATLSPSRPSTSNSVMSPMPTSAAPSISMPSPALSAVDMRPPTPLTSNPPSRIPTPTPPPTTGSVFALPYRMIYAVVTMDTVAIHDTQQAGPIAMLTKLHYDEFTDAAWTPDGHCLMLSSRDGYCTIIVFDDVPPTHHSPRLASRLATFAMPSVGLAPSLTPSSSATSPAPSTRKRAGPPTPAQSVDGDAHATVVSPERSAPSGDGKGETKEPPKKKRRIQLTHVGELGS